VRRARVAAAFRARWQLLTAILGHRQAILFAAGVVASHVVAAWCNVGFVNADEHYQILEFAQYKLGYQSADALAWEFAMRMRPTLQPWLAAGAIRAHHLAGVTSPFAIAFSLRLVSALLAIIVSFELCGRCLPAITSRGGKLAALFLSFFLWGVPTAHGRFSSENWGGIWLAAGLCLFIDALNAEPRSPAPARRLAGAAGLLWAIAFYCRFQVGFAIAGALLWLFVVRRRSASLGLAIALGLAAGFVANEILDYGLYGSWTIAPINYVWQNLVEGRAATFGTAPWWMISVYVTVALIPPYSLALIGVLGLGSWLARRDLLVWVAVPFFVAHALVDRKDPRFLIPLLYVLGPWFGVCVDRLRLDARDLSPRWRTAGAAAATTFCVLNVVVMSVLINAPCQRADCVRSLGVAAEPQRSANDVHIRPGGQRPAEQRHQLVLPQRCHDGAVQRGVTGHQRGFAVRLLRGHDAAGYARSCRLHAGALDVPTVADGATMDRAAVACRRRFRLQAPAAWAMSDLAEG